MRWKHGGDSTFRSRGDQCQRARCCITPKSWLLCPLVLVRSCRATNWWVRRQVSSMYARWAFWVPRHSYRHRMSYRCWWWLHNPRNPCCLGLILARRVSKVVRPSSLPPLWAAWGGRWSDRYVPPLLGRKAWVCRRQYILGFANLGKIVEKIC